MKGKIVWAFLSSLIAIALLLAACAPAAPPTAPVVPTPTATATATPSQPSQPPAPATPAKTAVASPTEPQYGGTITVVELNFNSLDPVRYDASSNRGGSFVFEKLVIGDWAVARNVWDFPSGTGRITLELLKGELLESWETPDNLTIILHVRKGVRWQDKPPVSGREFTADDVTWNLQRHLKSTYADNSYTGYIQTVTTLDKYTVELKLKPPPRAELVRGILDTNNLHFAPKEAVGKSGEIEDWRNMIGTGPFMVSDYVPASALTFKKNPNYWGYDERNPKNRLPYADNVKWLIVPDRFTQLAGLRTGQITQLVELEYQDGDSLKKTNPELMLRMLPHSMPRTFRWRTDKKPFDDVRVRQALSMAIDRQEMVKTFFGGYATPYTGMLQVINGSLFTPYEKLPDKPKWTTVSVKEVLGYNPQKAKQLLAEAGYPNGFKTWIDTTLSRDPSGMAEVIQAYLGNIGVQAEIRNLEKGAFDTIRMGFKHEQIILHWNDGNPNPLHLLGFYLPGNMYNMSLVNDPVFAEMYNRAITTFDDAKRGQMAVELEMYSLERAWALSMPHPQMVVAWQPWLKGYQGEGYLGIQQMGALFARLWVDQRLKNK